MNNEERMILLFDARYLEQKLAVSNPRKRKTAQARSDKAWERLAVLVLGRPMTDEERNTLNS